MIYYNLIQCWNDQHVRVVHYLPQVFHFWHYYSKSYCNFSSFEECRYKGGDPFIIHHSVKFINFRALKNLNSSRTSFYSRFTNVFGLNFSSWISRKVKVSISSLIKNERKIRIIRSIRRKQLLLLAASQHNKTQKYLQQLVRGVLIKFFWIQFS